MKGPARHSPASKGAWQNTESCLASSVVGIFSYSSRAHTYRWIMGEFMQLFYTGLWIREVRDTSTLDKKKEWKISVHGTCAFHMPLERNADGITHTEPTNQMISEILIDWSFLGIYDDLQRPFVVAFPAKSPRSNWTTLEWFSAAAQFKDLVYDILRLGCIGRTISGSFVADSAFLLSVQEIAVKVLLSTDSASPIGMCRGVHT